MNIHDKVNDFTTEARERGHGDIVMMGARRLGDATIIGLSCKECGSAALVGPGGALGSLAYLPCFKSEKL